jgi:hypothetical protein
MKRVALVIAALALSSPAPAAEPELTIDDCLTILVGLNGLDGHQALTRDNTVVVLSYKFENAKLRGIIQENIAALGAVQSNLQKVQQQIFKEVAGSKFELRPDAADPAERALLQQYQKQALDARQGPCKATLSRISLNDLRLDKNEIPGSILAALSKILDK